MKLKNGIFLFLVIIWTFVIFYASSRDSNDSNSKSKELIYSGIKVVGTITNKIKLTDIDLEDEKWLQKTTTILNKPLRKCAHAAVYFILGILLMILFYNLSYPLKKAFLVSILICFTYSLTDEYHQTLVEGRTGQFSDCLIDTVGAMLGSSIFYTIQKKKEHEKWKKDS